MSTNYIDFGMLWSRERVRRAGARMNMGGRLLD